MHESVSFSGENTIITTGQDSLVWVWSLGVGACCVDLETGSAKSYRLDGIHALSVRSDRVVLIGIDRIVSIFEGEEIQQNVFPFEFGCRYYGGPFGLIRFSAREFTLLSLPKFTVIGWQSIDEMREGDSIREIYHIGQNSLGVASYSGGFFVYQMLSSGDSVLFKRIFCVDSEKFVETAFDFSSEAGVIFGSAGSACCVRPDKSLLPLLVTTASAVSTIPNSGEPFVIQANGGSEFSLFNWWDNETEKVCFDVMKMPFSSSLDSLVYPDEIDIQEVSDRSITCLITRHVTHLRTEKRQIIAGTQSGSVHFFWDDRSSPFALIDALSAPIVGLVPLPDACYRQCLLALGSDGSCALLTQSRLLRLFDINGFPIVRVYAEASQSLIVLETIDATFSVFSEQNSHALAQLSVPLSNAPLLWSSREIHISNGVSNLRFNRQGIWIRVIDVAEVITFQAKTCVGEIRLLAQALECRDQRKVGCCFVGVHQSCTLFWPSQSVDARAALSASHSVAALHYLSLVLIARALDTQSTAPAPESIAAILPGLTPFVFSQSAEIQTAAIEACASALNCVSTNLAKAWSESVTPSTAARSDAESLLFAMIAAVAASAIPRELHLPLLHFLWHVCESDALPRSLALVVLLIGRDVWSKVAKRLSTPITRFVMLENCLPMVRHLYTLVCGSDQVMFVTAIRDLLSENLTADELRALCQLITAVALDTRSVFGPRGSLELARIAARGAAFADAAEPELAKHVAAFPSVANDGESLVIGTPDGWVYAFQRRKLQFEGKVCQSAIDCVSIGPGNWAFVLSTQDAVGRLVPITKAGRKPREVAGGLDVSRWRRGCEIVWEGPERVRYS
jgi:hypothetical protein